MYRSKRVGIYVKHCDAGSVTCDAQGNIYQKGIMKPVHVDKDGYKAVFMDAIEIPCHQIIAYLKYGKESIVTGIVTRHLNGDKQDNSWGNIAIGTPLDNSNDIPAGVLSEAAKRVWNARTPEQRSEHLRKVAANTSEEKLSAKGRKANAAMTPELRKANAKKIMAARGFRTLTDEQKVEVVALYKTGEYSQDQLAAKFNVGQGCISNCILAAGASKVTSYNQNIYIALSHVTTESRRKAAITRGGNILTPEQHVEVKQLYATGDTSHEKLAKQFKCSATQIRRIIIGAYDQ